MLQRTVASTIEFMDTIIEDDGSNCDHVQKTEFAKLLAMFPKIMSDRGDVTSAVKLLKAETQSFTAEQAKQLRAALGSLATVDADASGTKQTTTTKTQNHEHMHQYLTERRWARILSENATIATVIDDITDQMVEIGMLWPAPKPTKAHVVSFIFAVRGMTCDPSEMYDVQQKLTDSIVLKRKCPRPGAPSPLPSYPEDAMQFAVAHPSAYSLAEPLVPWQN